MDSKIKTLITKRNIPKRNELKEGTHFYYNESGYMVFTELYHKMRGYCCNSGCKHCPYGFKK